MCARGGSGEHFFAPVSFLICFCAAWPSLGKVFPSPSQPEHRPAPWERSIPSLCFHAEIAEKSTALIYSDLHNTCFSGIFHIGVQLRELSCPTPAIYRWLKMEMDFKCTAAAKDCPHLTLASNGSFNEESWTTQTELPSGSLFPVAVL